MANDNVANDLVEARQYDRALEKCRRILEMDPNFELAHFHLSKIYWRTGLYKEAVAEIQTLAQFRKYRRSGQLAYIYAASGTSRKPGSCSRRLCRKSETRGIFTKPTLPPFT